MAKNPNITAEYVRQLLDYDPRIGELTWESRTPDMFISSGNWSIDEVEDAAAAYLKAKKKYHSFQPIPLEFL